MLTDQVKEKLIHANEQKRYQESDIARYQDKIDGLNDKIESLRAKKDMRKQTSKALKEEKAVLEGQNLQLQEQIVDLKGHIEKSQKENEAK